MRSFKNAFSMLELIMVIVIIGILSAIAIPRFAASRDDAQIAKARTTVAAIRSAIGAEKQKRILRGNFVAITTLGDNGDNVFDTFDNGTERVVEYSVRGCEEENRGCWTTNKTGADTEYTYRLPSSTEEVVFKVEGNRFICQTTPGNCDRLE